MIDVFPATISRRVAMLAFARLSERWRMHRDTWPNVLHKSRSTLYAWLREARLGAPAAETALEADVAERLAHLFAIYNGLHLLFAGGGFADEWVAQPNRAFGGRKPLDVILSGRFDDLLSVRQYVDRANAA